MNSTQVMNSALIGGPESILIDAARLAVADQAAFTFYDIAPILEAPSQEVESAPTAFTSAFRHIFAQSSPTKDTLIREAFRLLEECHLALPTELIPELTHLNKNASRAQKRDFAERLSRVVGARGRWFIEVTQPGFFDVALELPTEADWESDSVQRRVSFLKDLHASEPEKAREYIASALHKRDKNREEYIATLRDCLSPEDEPVLILAVHDRKQSVRKGAGELLALVDQSAYIDRAIEIARESFRDALKYPGSLTVYPPEMPSRTTDPLGWTMLESAQRPYERINKIVELIPPHRLSEIGLDVKALALDTIIEGHPTNLGRAFATSIIRWKDHNAARTLLQFLPLGELAAILPEKEMVDALLSFLSSREFGAVWDAFKILLAQPDRSLSAELSRTIMTYIEHVDYKGYSFYLHDLTLFLTTYCDISVSEEISTRLSVALQGGYTAGQALTIIHIRQQIHQSLSL